MSNNNGNQPLGPDPNEIGYDECIVDDETSGGSSNSGGTSAAGPNGTCCDLDIENNVWVEGVVDVPAGKRGICMLDTMSYEQVVQVLRHDPKAREDLPKVTSNQELLTLLATVPLLGQTTLNERLQSANTRNGLPYYTVFRGQPPNAQFYPPKKK